MHARAPQSEDEGAMQRRLPTTLVFKRGIYKRKAIAMALETSTGELLRVSGLTASVDEKEILHGMVDASSF